MVSYRYLGYGITDENGVAKLKYDPNGDEMAHSYTGVGAGEVDIVASTDDPQHISGTSLQETYPLLDATFYDKGLSGDGNHNDNWFNQNNGFDVVRGDSYTTLSRKGTGWQRFAPNISSVTTYPFSIGTCIEFKLGTVTGNWNFTIPKTSESLSNLDIGLINDSNKTIKITVGETNIIIEKDGAVVDTKTTSEYIDDDFQCYFIINLVNSIQYKDFKIYPI